MPSALRRCSRFHVGLHLQSKNQINSAGDCSPLRQWNALPIVVQNVFHFDRVRSNAKDSVAPVNDVTFPRHENVVALLQENFARFTAAVGITKEFQVDRRGVRRTHWLLRSRMCIGYDGCADLRYVYLCPENVPSLAFILCFFTCV